MTSNCYTYCTVLWALYLHVLCNKLLNWIDLGFLIFSFSSKCVAKNGRWIIPLKKLNSFLVKYYKSMEKQEKTSPLEMYESIYLWHHESNIYHTDYVELCHLPHWHTGYSLVQLTVQTSHITQLQIRKYSINWTLKENPTQQNQKYCRFSLSLFMDGSGKCKLTSTPQHGLQLTNVKNYECSYEKILPYILKTCFVTTVVLW